MPSKGRACIGRARWLLLLAGLSVLAAAAGCQSAPEKVTISGYAQRLRPPRWLLSFEQAQILSGIAASVVIFALLVGAFFALMHLPHSR